MQNLLPVDYLNTNKYPMLKRFKLAHMINRAPKFTLQVSHNINAPLHTITVTGCKDVFDAIERVTAAWLARNKSVLVRVVPQ